MAHQRTTSIVDGQKEPHSVSLKVLRLSRPSLARQFPLPEPDVENKLDFDVPNRAALSYPSENTDDAFILSPVLTLPPAFGSAYVGEAFSCTLCANNELSTSDNARVITSVRIGAEMQTPSQTVPLQLTPAEDEAAHAPLAPGRSLQKIVQYDLKEEGSHVLVVTVTYSETSMRQDEGENAARSQVASGGRVRTFRKLYQFLTQQCLAVRTKTAELPSQKAAADVKDATVAAPAAPARFVLEAQLENMGESPISLEVVSVAPKSPLKATSLNWDVRLPGQDPTPSPVLNPREVMQVAFLMRQDTEQARAEGGKETRITLGQLCIEWRSAMGDRGFLSTGWLSCRRR
ncbi:MAG: hypothetical protein M1825_003394 [Sarcosagium campestre]|nr:MAG: hypothetical protein M1825_003394 [Sarcosagium campestre]